MSLPWMNHLIIAPILVPLLVGALLVLVNERRHQLKLAINLSGVVLLLAVAVQLARLSDGEAWPSGIGVYMAANWAAPFGIVLVADRLSALMLMLTAVLALAALLFATARWSRTGVHFHSLFQFLLMGLNGAFLTGDLFNLFVFFEVMLAASYGLLLHGYNSTRVRAGMQYITVNLVSSFLFLIGVALIYGAAGTLNIADLALRAGALDAADRMLFETGAAILAVAFLTKSAMWPLCFWLPGSYSAASPPVAAMMVLMTKVGFYVVMRLWLQVFSDAAGDSAQFGSQMLFWGGMATLSFGAIGLLSSQEAGRMAGYSAIVSSGTLLAVLSSGQVAAVGAALFYLVSSTLAVAAFLLLAELIERLRTPGAAMLALTMEAFAMEDAPEESAGVAIPAGLAFLGLAFIGCALVISGMPPLSGFLAKFSMFHALLRPTDGEASLWAFALIGLVLAAGLAAIISLMRFGVRTFWAGGEIRAPHLRPIEAAPISLLLLACVAMTILANPISAYMDRAAEGIHRPVQYVERVLGEAPVPSPSTVAGAHP